MMDSNDLKQISNLLDEKLAPIKNQLDTVEIKIELVNKKVEKSQQETIETLSDLINTSYNLHEERIKTIEKQLHSS